MEEKNRLYSSPYLSSRYHFLTPVEDYQKIESRLRTYAGGI